MRKLHVLVIAAAFAVACGGKQQPPPDQKVPPTNPEATESSKSVDEFGAMALAFADKLAAAINSGDGDCSKIGKNLSAMAGDVRAVMSAEDKIESDPAKKKAFEEKYEPQLDAKLRDAMPKLESCMSHPDVKAFIDQMAGEAKVAP